MSACSHHSRTANRSLSSDEDEIRTGKGLSADLSMSGIISSVFSTRSINKTFFWGAKPATFGIDVLTKKDFLSVPNFSEDFVYNYLGYFRKISLGALPEVLVQYKKMRDIKKQIRLKYKSNFRSFAKDKWSSSKVGLRAKLSNKFKKYTSGSVKNISKYFRDTISINVHKLHGCYEPEDYEGGFANMAFGGFGIAGALGIPFNFKKFKEDTARDKENFYKNKLMLNELVLGLWDNKYFKTDIERSYAGLYNLLLTIIIDAQKHVVLPDGSYSPGWLGEKEVDLGTFLLPKVFLYPNVAKFIGDLINKRKADSVTSGEYYQKGVGHIYNRLTNDRRIAKEYFHDSGNLREICDRQYDSLDYHFGLFPDNNVYSDFVRSCLTRNHSAVSDKAGTSINENLSSCMEACSIPSKSNDIIHRLAKGLVDNIGQCQSKSIQANPTQIYSFFQDILKNMRLGPWGVVKSIADGIGSITLNFGYTHFKRMGGGSEVDSLKEDHVSDIEAESALQTFKSAWKRGQERASEILNENIISRSWSVETPLFIPTKYGDVPDNIKHATQKRASFFKPHYDVMRTIDNKSLSLINRERLSKLLGRDLNTFVQLGVIDLNDLLDLFEREFPSTSCTEDFHAPESMRKIATLYMVMKDPSFKGRGALYSQDYKNFGKYKVHAAKFSDEVYTLIKNLVYRSNDNFYEFYSEDEIKERYYYPGTHNNSYHQMYSAYTNFTLTDVFKDSFKTFQKSFSDSEINCE